MHESYALACRLGFDSILTGDFAEFVLTMNGHLGGHLLMHRRWKAFRDLTAIERQRGVSRKNLGRQLIISFVPGWLANIYFRIRHNKSSRLPDWIDHRKVDRLPYRPDLVPPPRRRWSVQQLGAFHGSTVMLEADELCATLNGVTVRRPFADIDLWEFFLSLPAEVRFPDLRSKTLVRRMLRGKLPDTILDRRDKTFFDDFAMSQLDYPTLRQFLINPNYHMDGVDYRRLAVHIDNKDFNLADFHWVNDLTRIHAFLSLW